jgi:mannose-6-phosphate isomerase-like protein (cupin superfamily)
MNIPNVIEELKKKYPGKKIFLNNRQNCTEILCEVEPTGAHTTYSEAVSVIDKTDAHFHDKTTEIYKVIKGVLTLIVDGRKFVLNDGQSLTISPGQVHEAIGNETWIKCSAKPGWKKSDHHLTKKSG